MEESAFPLVLIESLHLIYACDMSLAASLLLKANKISNGAGNSASVPHPQKIWLFIGCFTSP